MENTSETGDMNLYGQSSQKSQNIKFIIVTVLVALVILGIVVWAILFFVNGRNKKPLAAQTNQTTTTSQTENAAQTENTGENTSDVVAVTEIGDATSTTDGVNASEPAQATSDTKAPSEVQDNSTASTISNHEDDNMPKTGPEDILPLALIAGAAAAYLSSRTLAKRSA